MLQLPELLGHLRLENDVRVSIPLKTRPKIVQAWDGGAIVDVSVTWDGEELVIEANRPATLDIYFII